MYSPFQLGLKYLKYYVSASNGRGHGIHSPFVFSFITQVLNDERHFYAYDSVEMMRQLLLNDHQLLEIEDFEAGTKIRTSSKKKVSAIAKASLKPKKIDQLLFRMVDHYASKRIVALGTSLGITTSYLASARANSNVITLESASKTTELARNIFKKLQLQNIEWMEGDFDKSLSVTLQKMKTLDLVLVDRNHHYASTIRYVKEILPLMQESSILIMNDIHRSAEMEKTWEEIKKDPLVTLTIDLFFIGLVFFRKEQKVKQDFVIRF